MDDTNELDCEVCVTTYNVLGVIEAVDLLELGMMDHYHSFIPYGCYVTVYITPQQRH